MQKTDPGGTEKGNAQGNGRCFARLQVYTDKSGIKRSAGSYAGPEVDRKDSFMDDSKQLDDDSFYCYILIYIV